MQLIEKLVSVNKSACRYHSTQHLIGVAVISKMLGAGEDTQLAALLHDYQYPNLSNDKDNIEHSIEEAVKDFDINDRVKNLIRGTEFNPENPHPIVYDESIKILRDADQLYATVFIKDCWHDLYHAIGKDKLGLSEAEFIVRNIGYVKSFNGYTEAGKLLHEIYVDRAVEFMESKL